jgi:preprotein translocase subunit SecD
MKKNLLWRAVLILAILVVFIWGIFLGTDPQKSIEAIKANGLVAGIQQNIHLGLDLRGGTHLILQVQVNDAVNAETDQTIERLKDALPMVTSPSWIQSQLRRESPCAGLTLAPPAIFAHLSKTSLANMT